MSSSIAIPYDTNVSNFVSMKLSGKHNYHFWKAQILCLFNSLNICGILDDTFVGPRDSNPEIMKQYDNLVRGWIFGSVSEVVLEEVYNLDSAKAVWEKLQSNYNTTIRLQEEKEDRDAVSMETNTVVEEGPTEKESYAETEIETEAETHTKTQDRDDVSAETNKIDEGPILTQVIVGETNTVVEEGPTEINTIDEGPILTQVIVGEINIVVEEGLAKKESHAEAETKTKTQDIDIDIDDVSAETNTIDEGPIVGKNKMERKNILKKVKTLVTKGDWPELNSMINNDLGLLNEAISSDGSTIFHIAVGIGHNDIVKNFILRLLTTSALEKKRDFDGSTALHIAAIVGNKVAAQLLVTFHEPLLLIKDQKDKTPLDKAYENMHLDTIAYLLKAVKKYYPETFLVLPDDKAANLIVNAIYAKRYSLAREFMNFFPKAVSRSDNVLMALAKTFPSGLDDGEKLIYPSLKGILELLRKTAWVTLYLFACPALLLHDLVTGFLKHGNYKLLLAVVITVLLIVPFMLASAFGFIYLLILTMRFPFLVLYYHLWKGANILAFPPIKKIEKKIMERNEAKKILARVCDEIDKLDYSGTHHPYYAQPILEAACQNAYDVVKEILSRSPEAIRSKDESEYDIIQLAIINRSDKIYNLIYDVDERKNLHKTYKDPSGNNILHLAGRLAPLSVLNQRTGAALQLQRELQWRKEVKKLVIPTYITQENSDKETPDMVFTKEHKDLVKEGEQWMKTTAESCSITAALIITIVFAAAITVPGGNNQEKGTPLFKKEPAFIIFAISDAISLFASSTALLVFLSILTARFAENDFLVSLPRRLFIGLFSLLLSTTAMMVSFSATLFLVFCDKNLLMLAPICVLALIPIAFFVGLQFPLMVDLFRSTYLPSIGKERKVSFKTLIQKTYEHVFYNVAFEIPVEP